MSFSVYQLKPRFQQLLRPVLARLVQWHVTPNQITLLAMVLSLLYGAALAWQPGDLWLWAGLPVFMLLRMALNALDGMLANFSGQKSRWGALLNEVGDQVSDAALVLPFALASGIHAPLVVVAALGALLVEFAGVLALLIGSPRRYDGPMGKSDRAVAFGLLALLLLAGASSLWLNGLLVGVLVLLGWTLANRLRSALRSGAPPTP